MDIVTHGIAGALISRAIPRGGNLHAVMAASFGALAPDLDAAARLWDPLAVITIHRTATHSFLGGAVIALLVALPIAFFKGKSFLSILAVAYLGVLSHLGLDLLTSFGVAILWPFSDHRFALGYLYLLDPIVSAIALGSLLISFLVIQKRVFVANLGLLGLLLYVLVAVGFHSKAVSLWQGFIQAQGLDVKRSVVVPLFPGPLRWMGVAETGEAFFQKSFWIYKGDFNSPTVVSKTEDADFQVGQLVEVKRFLNLARFPVKRTQFQESFRIIEYQDLAFADHPFGILGGPFALRIWLDEVGTVTSIELGHQF